MKKRIFAVLLVLALVITVGAVAAFATEGTETETTTTGPVCPCHGMTIEQIDASEENGWVDYPVGQQGAIEDGKHYRFAESQTLSMAVSSNSTVLVVSAGVEALLYVPEGVDVAAPSGKRFMTVSEATTEDPTKLTICGSGTISGGGNGGSVLSVCPSTVVDLYDVTLTNSNTTRTQPGGVVEITAGTEASYGVINMHSGTMNGGTLKAHGGAVSLRNYAVFNMYDGTINSATASGKNGGCVYINYDGTFNMYDGHLNASGKSLNWGAAVCIQQGTFLMEKGTITGGKAGRGGAVLVRNGTFTMNGGEIVGGTAETLGNTVAIYDANGTFIMNGGTVTGTSDEYGLISGKGSTIELNGGAVCGNIIADTTANKITVSGDAIAHNIDLSVGSGTIAIGTKGLGANASIGVTKDLGAAFTTATASAADAQYFYGASVRATAVCDEPANTLSLQANNACPHCPGETPTWEVYTNQTTTGHYFLNKDFSTSGQYKIGDYETNAEGDEVDLETAQDIVIDLYGLTMTNTNSRFSVRTNDKFSLLDSRQGGKLIGHQTASGGALNLNAGAEFTLHSGAVVDGYTGTRGTSAYGGAIDFAAAGAQVTIKGGTVTGNHANYGAAIGVRNSGTLKIEGGEIIGGTATQGGAICVMQGTLEMTGGTVMGGYATKGGAVYIGSGSMNFTGGTITSSKSGSGNGGAVHIDGGEFTLNGGEITKCTSSNWAGGVYVTNGTFTMISGKITDCEAAVRGGGVAVTTNGVFTMQGGEISGNTLDQEDGLTGTEVYLRQSTSSFTMTGGTISGPDATNDVGAVNVRAGTVAISGGEIVGVVRSKVNITLSGDPVIQEIDLVSTSTENDVNGLIVIGDAGFETDASIGITAAQDTPFTVANAELAEASCEYFHNVAGVLAVDVVENCLVLVELMIPCPHCGYNGEWTDWNGATHLKDADAVAAANGHYRLTATPAVSATQLQVGTADTSFEVCIDLNGYSITRTDISSYANGGRVFAVYGDTTLNLVNTGNTRSVLTGTKFDDLGGVINLAGTANLTIEGNITLVHDASGYSKNGGVFAVAGGEVIIEEGVILTGDVANLGGAVFVGQTGGSFVMNGGTINGGTVTRGGAVYVDNGSFVMNNGTINGGTATWGGAVCLIDSTNDENATTFTMYNGTINGGTATRGAAIYAQNNNPVITIVDGTVNGGVINGNDGGGTIGLGSGTATLNMNGGVVNGSQITAEEPRGGTAICNFASSATLNMNGGTINGYEGGTTANGGAIYSDGKVFYTAGTINGCTSASGDVMYFGTASAELVMTLANNTEAMDAFNGKIVTVDSDDVTSDAGYMVNDTNDVGTWYKDIEAAKENYVNGGYLTVLADGDITLDGQTVDVNGHSITISGTATCFDSSNDDYDGYAVVTMETAPATYVNAPNGNLYITVKEAEGQYSFHRLTMQFERLSLRPSKAGVYYSSSWRGDEVLTGTLSGMKYESNPIITGYGMALKKKSAATSESFSNGVDKFAYTYFDNDDGVVNDFLCKNNGTEINSCLLTGIISTSNEAAETNKENAQVKIYATPYVEIRNYEGEYEYVMGETYANDLKGIVEYVVSTIAAMAEGDSKTKYVENLKPLYNNFCATDDYGLNDFFDGLEELVAPTAE